MKGDISPRTMREIQRFARESGIHQVILFGSRARGTSRDRSDIDLAIRGGDMNQFTDLVQEQLHSLLMVDVVGLTEQTSVELLKEIERDGIVLYEESR